MDARGFFSIVLTILLVAVTLSSSDSPTRHSRAPSIQATHHPDPDSEEGEESRPYLLRLFEKYGTNGQMTFEGFEHLFESIGLGNVQIGDHDVHDHHTDEGFREFHSDHEHNGSMKGRSAADEEKEREEEEAQTQSMEDAASAEGDGRKVVKGVEKKERRGRKNGRERTDGEMEGRQKRSSSVLFVEQKVRLSSMKIRQIIPDEGNIVDKVRQ